MADTHACCRPKLQNEANARVCGAVATVVGFLALRAALGGSERDSTHERLFMLFVVCTSTPNQVNLSSYRAAWIDCLISS